MAIHLSVYFISVACDQTPPNSPLKGEVIKSLLNFQKFPPWGEVSLAGSLQEIF